VVVKPVEIEETRYGNIVVPDLGNETNKTAEVVGVGPGHVIAGGNFVPTQLHIGDIVVLPTMGFTKFEYEVYHILLVKNIEDWLKLKKKMKF
jgi:co-chaperonin GroES (HSP10)